MTYSCHHHVPGDQRNNAPPSQQFAENALSQSLPNIARPRAKLMDASKTLRADGFIVIGPMQPESTQNEPEVTALVTLRPAGRWTELVWVDIYDSWVQTFEEKWLPQIEPLQGKIRILSRLVVYMDRDKSLKWAPADDEEEHFWVFLVTHPGPGFFSFWKGSHVGNVAHMGKVSYTTPGPLTKRSIVIFDGRLYRQEPEVKGKGITGVLLKYGLKRL